jgi:hypothetical protein
VPLAPVRKQVSDMLPINRPTSPPPEDTSGSRIRGLSVKRSSQPSPLSNLEKLKNLSQTRLPRVLEEKTRPKVELTDAEIAGIAELKSRLTRDGIARCTIPGHHASDDGFIGRFVKRNKEDKFLFVTLFFG